MTKTALLKCRSYLKGLQWLLLLPLLLLAGESLAVTPLSLSTQMQGVSGDSVISYLKDEEHRYSFDDILSEVLAAKFAPLPDLNPNFGLSKASYWLRLDISNPGSKALDWYLEITHPQWDEVDFYIEGHEAVRLGDHRSFSQRPVAAESNLLPVTTMPGEQQRIWVHLSNDYAGIANTALKLWTPDAFHQQYSHRMLIIGGLLGAALILFFYNLFIGFSTRMNVYIWYTSYILTTFFCLLSITGLGYRYIWSGWIWLSDFSMLIFIAMMLLLASQFTRHFLQTRKEFIQADRLLLTVMGMAILIIICAIFSWRYLAIQLCFSAVMISLSYPFIGLRQYFHGMVEARFYVVAWSVWSLSVLVGLFRDFGIIPIDFVTSFAPGMGLLMEGALLSFALADRINVLQQERDEMEQKHLLYLQNQREVLETMVGERTMELQGAIDTAEMLARTDPLTGVANRRAFFEQGEHELQRFKRHQTIFSVIMVDVDLFKAVNDRYGHGGGDAALVALANTFKETVRSEDLICRFGGEEFSILLPHTDLEFAASLAERLRAAIEAMQVDWQGEVMQFTASFGLASAGAEEDKTTVVFEDLVNHADLALYRAKELGRNRVSFTH